MRPQRRLQLLGGASLIALLGLAGKLYAVSIARHAELSAKARSRSRRADVLPARRGQILASDGRPLALDLPVDDVALDLLDLDPALELIAPVGSALGLSRAAAWVRLLDARALAREQPAEDPTPVLLGAAPLAAAERVRKALRRAQGLSLSYEPTGVAVLAAPERLVEVDRTLTRLAGLLEVTPADLAAVVAAEVEAILAVVDREARIARWRRPLVVRAEAPFDVVARVAERQDDLPGVRVQRRYRRLYPRGELAAHLVGTLSAPSPEEQARDRAAGLLVDEGGRALGLLMGEREDLPPDARLRDQAHGRTGVERAFDEALRGRPGVRVVVRDAKGRTRSTLTDLAPQDGRDLTLTIDADLQAVVEAALDQAVAKHGDLRAGGAAVVLDLRRGDVLTLASSPRYDPNVMGARFDEWNADPRLPLFDRSVSAFPPASTWKILTAFALTDASEPDRAQQALPLGWTTDCQGKLFPGRTGPFKCDGHHGATDLGRAIERSCNVFFFRAADRIGLDPLSRWADRFGLRRPLVGLPGERAGFVPSTGFKAARVADSAGALQARWGRTIDALAAQGGDPTRIALALRKLDRSVWWLGCCLSDRTPLPADARNAFIGQGVVLATPVQVAWLAAVVATGGRTPTPRLDRDAPVTFHDAPLPAAALARVRDGMRRVVTSGTASDRKLGLRGLDVAGKTGTAERLKDQPKLAWFMGYYPASRPQVAFAVLVDRTDGHGGEVCAPVAKAIVDALSKVKR